MVLGGARGEERKVDAKELLRHLISVRIRARVRVRVRVLVG